MNSRRRGRPFALKVAYADQFGARQPHPGILVKMGEIPRPNDGYANGHNLGSPQRLRFEWFHSRTFQWDGAAPATGLLNVYSL